MPIRVTCNTCLYSFSVSDSQSGKRGLCPDCGGPIDVPRGSRSGGGQRADREGPSSRSAPRPYRSPGKGRASGSAGHGNHPAASFWFGASIAGVVAVLVVVIGLAAFLLGRSSASQPEASPSVATTSPAPQPAAAAAVQPEPPQLPAVSTVAGGPQQQGNAQANNASVTQAAASDSAAPVVASDTSPAATSSVVAGSGRKTYASAADLVEAVEPSVCRIEVKMAYGDSQGSGYVIDAANGIIATNYHVIADADNAKAIFPDKTEAPVLGVLKLDAKKDIALLKIDAPAGKKLVQVALASEFPRKGEEVIAIGAPLGFDFSVSEGKISAIRTSAEIIYAPHEMDGTWIQTTTPISPGNSGGPLFNMRGEVVAMNTMTYTAGQNLNFCISAPDVRDAYDKRSLTLTALTPATVPGSAQQAKKTSETIVDGTKTEEGRDLLAGIDEALLIVGYFAFDPTGRVADYVKTTAERSFERADIKITPTEQALILVTMDLTGARDATSGTQALTISAHVLVRTQGDGGKERVVKVWEDEATVGTISLNSLFRGVIPRITQTNMTSFFNKFRSDLQKARKELEQRSTARP